jgi:hypothetical protein
MGLIDRAVGALFRRQGRFDNSVQAKLEQHPQQENDAVRALELELEQWRAGVPSSSRDVEAELDALRSNVAHEQAALADLEAALQAAEADLQLEKANRSAAVYLLKKHGVVDGIAYASFSREQRVELLAAAMDEVAGKETTSRWRARAPASRRSK